jgi:hypothetical protein
MLTQAWHAGMAARCITRHSAPSCHAHHTHCILTLCAPTLPAVGSAGFPSALAISAQPMSNSSQAYTLGAMYSNGSNKRARWTLDEIEALVEGCEKYGPGGGRAQLWGMAGGCC